MRYFLNFSYHGKNYHGWQKQPNALTVQEVLEERLSRLLGNPTAVTAAGRTDAGVHATSMTAHFDAEEINLPNLIYRLNAYLPSDIAVNFINPVQSEAHARFDATSRTYNYFIHYAKNPFRNDVSWFWNYEKLNIKKMNEAARILLDYTDFTSFAKLHTDNKSNTCRVSEAFWSENDENLVFTISADRFLRNMVRSVVGTLVETGRNKISTAQFVDIIVKKDRKFASASAPAHGLFLKDVKYPENIFL